MVLLSLDNNPRLLLDRQLRDGRRGEDVEYYSHLDPLMFDIPFGIDPAQSLTNIAQSLHLFIYSQIATQHYFPRPYLIDSIAKIRTSPEGKEGLNAFLEKRDPKWKIKTWSK